MKLKHRILESDENFPIDKFANILKRFDRYESKKLDADFKDEFSTFYEILLRSVAP